jgi:hypothetical protein
MGVAPSAPSLRHVGLGMSPKVKRSLQAVRYGIYHPFTYLSASQILQLFRRKQRKFLRNQLACGELHQYLIRWCKFLQLKAPNKKKV